MKDGRLPAACRLTLLCASAAAVINHGSLLEQELRPLKSSLRIFFAEAQSKQKYITASGNDCQSFS